jgi:hypothetical protein
MNGHSTLNKPDADFIAQADSINEQSHLHESDWELSATVLATFDTKLSTAKTAYEANKNRSTKNAVTAALKQEAFGDLKYFLSMYINTLEGNSNVPDSALQYMGLRPRHPSGHGPLPRPTDILVLSVIRQHDEMTVYASLPEHDQPTSSVGPKKHYGFALRYTIEGGLQQTITTTRLHHTLFFDRADEGKRVLLAGAWINPRLETGPWSDEISEIIG